MEKVSIIIPIYNEGRYLEECLGSVFCQSLTDIEVICINDGSTDNSLEILEKKVANDKRFRIISIENHGVGYARNLGIKEAKGECICFLDPDDKYPAKDVIESMYYCLKNNYVNICGGSAHILRNGIIETEHQNTNAKYQFSMEGIISYKDYQWSYGFWRFMYKKDFIINNKIFFPLYARYQDPPFLVNAMVMAKEFYALTKATYLYRANSKPIVYTYEKTKDCLLGMIDVLEISSKEKLEELHNTTIEHINTWLWLPLFKHLINGNKDLLLLLQHAKSKIDFSLIKLGETKETYQFRVEKELQRLSEVKKEERLFWEKCREYSKIIIYGAGYVGQKMGQYLQQKSKKINIFYAVTDLPDNVEYCNSIEIKCINDYIEWKEEALIIIATKDNLRMEILNNLEHLEFKNFLSLNNEMLRFLEILDYVDDSFFSGRN